MTDPCTQSETIKETYRTVRRVQEVHASLAESFKTLASGQEKIAASVQALQKVITDHMVDLARINERIDNHSQQISTLFTKVDHLNNMVVPELRGKHEVNRDKIAEVKQQIGTVSIADLDKQIAMGKMLLKGGWAIGIVVLGATVSMMVSTAVGG